jgi:hypothetical protein
MRRTRSLVPPHPKDTISLEKARLLQRDSDRPVKPWRKRAAQEVGVGRPKELGETGVCHCEIGLIEAKLKINSYKLPALCRAGRPKELGETDAPLQNREKRGKTEFKINPYEVCWGCQIVPGSVAAK